MLFILAQLSVLIALMKKRELQVYMMIWYAASLFACLGLRNTYEKTMDFRPTVCNALSTVLMILYCTLSLSSVSVFLYFNF